MLMILLKESLVTQAGHAGECHTVAVPLVNEDILSKHPNWVNKRDKSYEETVFRLQ